MKHFHAPAAEHRRPLERGKAIAAEHRRPNNMETATRTDGAVNFDQIVDKTRGDRQDDPWGKTPKSLVGGEIAKTTPGRAVAAALNR